MYFIQSFFVQISIHIVLSSKPQSQILILITYIFFLSLSYFQKKIPIFPLFHFIKFLCLIFSFHCVLSNRKPLLPFIVFLKYRFSLKIDYFIRFVICRRDGISSQNLILLCFKHFFDFILRFRISIVYLSLIGLVWWTMNRKVVSYR